MTILSTLSLALLAISSVVSADLRIDGGTEYGWDASEWYSQVDGVMGGKSSGSLRFEDSNSILSFSGDVVLDGGGFSSVRKRFSAMDLSAYAGIVVTLETTTAYDNGNSPPLGLHLQFHDTVSSYVGFASAFAVPLVDTVGQEVSVFLPLSSFDRGSRMGFTCNDCQIDFSSVDEMDIYVLFQSGLFDIRVKSITAVDAPVSYPSPAVDIGAAAYVKALIESTIQSGGGLYDYGYRGLCIAVYKSTLNTLLAADVFSKSGKSMICQGLQRAETQITSKVDAAWTLRNTLDAIMEEMGFSDPIPGRWRPDATVDAASLGYQCSGVTSVSVSNEIIPAPQAPTAAVDDEVAGKQNTDTMSTSANETKTMIDGGTASSAILASSGTSFSSIAAIVATLTASILLCFGL